MRRIASVIVVIGVGWTLAGASAAAEPSPYPPPVCLEPPPDMPPPTVAEIEARYTAWKQAVDDHDLTGVLAFYAPDAVLQPTFSPQVRFGTAAIGGYFEDLFEEHPQVTVSEASPGRTVTVLGPTGAADYGGYAFIPGPGTELAARYTFVYQRCGDTWLIVNHHSSEVPPEA